MFNLPVNTMNEEEVEFTTKPGKSFSMENKDILKVLKVPSYHLRTMKHAESAEPELQKRSNQQKEQSRGVKITNFSSTNKSFGGLSRRRRD